MAPNTNAQHYLDLAIAAAEQVASTGKDSTLAADLKETFYDSAGNARINRLAAAFMFTIIACAVSNDAKEQFDRGTDVLGPLVRFLKYSPMMRRG